MKPGWTRCGEGSHKAGERELAAFQGPSMGNGTGELGAEQGGGLEGEIKAFSEHGRRKAVKLEEGGKGARGQRHRREA